MKSSRFSPDMPLATALSTKTTLGSIISYLLAKGIYRELQKMNRRSFATIFAVPRSVLSHGHSSWLTQATMITSTVFVTSLKQLDVE
jgi:hypothetical protein